MVLDGAASMVGTAAEGDRAGMAMVTDDLAGTAPAVPRASPPARGVLARRLLGAVALAAALQILGGCQTGIGVSALNRCGQAVEVRADDSAQDFTTDWHPIGVDEKTEVATIAEDTRLIYVQVRANENALPMQFIATVAGRPKPLPGADNDVEIVLEGDRCPKAAG